MCSIRGRHGVPRDRKRWKKRKKKKNVYHENEKRKKLRPRLSPWTMVRKRLSDRDGGSNGVRKKSAWERVGEMTDAQARARAIPEFATDPVVVS